MTQVIETTRFGSVAITENDIIHFPEGMLGFSKLNDYILVERADESLFLWLQSVKKAGVAFPLLEPEIFQKNYQVDLLEEDKKILKLKDLKKAKIFAIVTIPSDPTKMTANLKAPIVLNLKEHLAHQVILHDADYPIRKAIYTDLQQYCLGTQRTIFPAEDAPLPVYQAVSLSGETEGIIKQALE